MSDPKKVDAVDKVLGEPWLADYGEDAIKVRRNLLVASILSIAISVAGIRVSEDSEIFGLHLKNLTEGLIRDGLAITVSYLLLHFGWYAVDALAGWRVRVTGTRQAFVTTGMFANQDSDYTGDFRQTTLYNWWRQKRTTLDSMSGRLPLIEKRLDEVKAILEKDDWHRDNGSNLVNVAHGIGEIKDNLSQLKSAIETGARLLEEPRVVASLRRFDRWYGLWLRSQNLRWLVVDTLVPIVAGILALYVLHTAA